MNGMDSSAFHHRLKASSTVFVYCSETSRNILLCDEKYKHLEKYLVGLPIEHCTMITYENAVAGKSETVSVTLLSAGHCIGSVMFLFEGKAGTVLYTGDFRWCKGDAARTSFFHTGDSTKDIHGIYVDTTFYLPQMKHIPNRECTRNAVLKLIKRWLSKGSNYYVSLLCKGMYGYEYLLKEVAIALHTKIHVSLERLALYKNLPDMTKYFTTNAESTRIHSCNWEHKRNINSKLPCGLSLPAPQKVNVMKIKATSMWFARRNEPLPNDCICQVSEDFYRVVHSMHASMEEIIDLVSYLRPRNVYPTVSPAGLHTIRGAQESLQQYTRCENEKGLTLKESVNPEDDEEIPVLSKEQKSTPLFSNISLSQSHPSDEVLAECKHLRLEEESFGKVRRKRRRNQTSSENCVTHQSSSNEILNGSIVDSYDGPLHKRHMVDSFENKCDRHQTL